MSLCKMFYWEDDMNLSQRRIIPQFVPKHLFIEFILRTSILQKSTETHSYAILAVFTLIAGFLLLLNYANEN